MARTMKDSGIEWIGMIPEEWSIKKVKHCFVRKNEKAEQENPVILSLARSGVKVRDVSTGEGQIAESYYNYNPVSVGDLLLNPMDLYSGANCSISKVEGVISPAYINLGAKKDIDARYYDYFFKTQYWGMVLFAHGKGVSYDNRWTLNAETLFNYLVPTPSKSEQQKIADYLDDKIGEIDAIISRTKISIEEYKKYKVGVITEAVLGSNRDGVIYKDVDNIFIKRIPIEWELCKLKYLSEEIGDGLHSTPEYDDEGDVYFINGNNIGGEYLEIKSSTNKLNDLEYSKYKKPLLNKQTIMIALNGATYGKLSFYNFEKVLLGKSAGYITLKDGVNKRYIKYYLQSSLAKNFMSLSLNGTTIQNLSLGTLNEMLIIVPAEVEQQEIVEYLNVKCGEIDALIAKKEAFVEEMEAYKKSLIYEYVTGKKEVV